MSEILTRNARRLYEELFLQGSMRGIDELLFPILDSDNSATFLLDKIVQTPYGITYRNQDNESNVRTITPGKGYTYTVPTSTNKTAITEAMRDMAQAGVEIDAGRAMHEAALLRSIVAEHTAGHNMTRYKQAIDVIRDAKFYARGVAGVDIQEDITYTRAGAMSTTYNFTTPGNTMAKILAAMLKLLKGKNCSMSGIVILMGASWLDKYGSDTSIQDNKETNSANVLVIQGMFPTMLGGVEGLTVLGQCRPAGCIAPITVCDFSPGYDYVGYKTSASAPWIPDNEAIMFSLQSPRYTIQRGLTILNAANKPVSANGRIVFDSFVENDPVAEYIRSGTRHAFVPANCDHTCRCVGTF